MDINIIFRIALVLQFAGYHIPRSHFRRRARKIRIEADLDRSELHESRISLFLMAVCGLGMNLVCLLWLINPDWLAWSNLDLPVWLRWIGIFAGMIAVIMGYFVHRTLDINFTPTLQTIKEHALISEGVYALIRHPMYTTFFLLFISSFLMTTNWLFAFLSLIYSLLLINRVRAEECMMVETLGDQYLIYMQNTGRFLPKLAHN